MWLISLFCACVDWIALLGFVFGVGWLVLVVCGLRVGLLCVCFGFCLLYSADGCGVVVLMVLLACIAGDLCDWFGYLVLVVS